MKLENKIIYYLTDLDGVLTKPDPNNQPPKGLTEADKEFWDFYQHRIMDERPNASMIKFLKEGLRIYNSDHSHMPIIIHTARPERFREQTVHWLKRWNVPYESLVMREDDDFSFDVEAKEKSLKSILQVMNEKPIAVFEDRQPLVEMYRKYGLLVFKVV